MIYWRIKYPGKSWREWADGVSDDVEEAQVDAMSSVVDDGGNLREPFSHGATVEMFRMIDIEDFKITKENVETYKTNYLGLQPST